MRVDTVIDWVISNKEWFLQGLGAMLFLGTLSLAGRFLFKKAPLQETASTTIEQDVSGAAAINVTAAGDQSGTSIQSYGSGSSVVQHQVVNVGVTIEEARKVALDVYRENALQLSGIAQDLARARVDSLTEDFLAKLASQNRPDALDAMKDPDFLHTFFEAQRAYARSGEQAQEELLVQLLVERADQGDRDLQQLVLNRAVQALPLLSQQHVDVMTLMWLVRDVRNSGLDSLVPLHQYLLANWSPLVASIPRNRAFFEYLESTGVASIEVFASSQLAEILRATYPGFFLKPVPEDELARIVGEQGGFDNLFTPPLRGGSGRQFRFIDKKLLDEEVQRTGRASESVRVDLVNLFDSCAMDNAAIAEELIALDPPIAQLNTLWMETPLTNTRLTPVGRAIAHANATRRGLEKVSLSVWLQ